MSGNALRALNAHWALPFYPIFEEQKSNGSSKKLVKQNFALKKTDRGKIIATIFVCEQLTNKLSKEKRMNFRYDKCH